jgi:hypothetical protein
VGAGTNGTAVVIDTEDAGSQWHRQSLPTAATKLSAVDCVKPSRCWAVGESASATVILTSTSRHHRRL